MFFKQYIETKKQQFKKYNILGSIPEKKKKNLLNNERKMKSNPKQNQMKTHSPKCLLLIHDGKLTKC